MRRLNLDKRVKKEKDAILDLTEKALATCNSENEKKKILDESNSIKMAVKRDDPKDVILEYNGSSLFGETCYAECPVCKNNFGDLADVSVGIYVPKFCDKCGQRLAQHSWLYYHKKSDKLKKESEKGNKT